MRREFPPLGGLPEAVATAAPLETSPLGVSIFVALRREFPPLGGQPEGGATCLPGDMFR